MHDHYYDKINAEIQSLLIYTVSINPKVETIAGINFREGQYFRELSLPCQCNGGAVEQLREPTRKNTRL